MRCAVRTKTLNIAYLESGPPDGPPVILLHGWPSDVHDWDGVVPPLITHGFHTLVPWLRGFGPTGFLDPSTPRSGQQAALGADLRAFMDTLGIAAAILVGCTVGPPACFRTLAQRVIGLVSITGYNIQNLATANRPATAEQERRYWYQWYLHTDRGVAGLTQDRRAMARLLWRLWSPNWQFTEATFDATASSFDNPDFVPVSLRSYRHRYGKAAGDPAFEGLERRLMSQPAMGVSTIVLHGACDGVVPPTESEDAQKHFGAHYERHVIPVAGHFLSREAPGEHDAIQPYPDAICASPWFAVAVSWTGCDPEARPRR